MKNFKLSYALLVFSMIVKSASAQQIIFPRNPPRALLASAGRDMISGDFSGKYNISKDSFMVLLNTYSSSGKDENFEGYEIKIDTVTYYIDTSYFRDAYKVFRYKPGGCGYEPGVILFDPLPDKEREALEFLAAHHYPLTGFDSNYLSQYDDTTSEDYRQMLKAIKEKYYNIEGSGENAYFVRAVAVMPFREEQVMTELQSSGLFSLLSRDAVPCGGYFSILRLKRKYVFGAGQPSMQSGTAFFRSYISSNLNRSVTIKITPISDFSYDISFTGPSSFLAIKKNNMWEQYSCTVNLQNGFDCKPDEMEFYFSFRDAAFAMGTVTAGIPPLARFTSSVGDDSGLLYQEKAKEYMRSLFGRIAQIYEGSKLSGF